MTATATPIGDTMGTASVADRVTALTTDEQGVITWCSPALEQLIGYPAEALMGGPPPRWLFDPDEVRAREQASGVGFGPALFATDPRRFDRRRLRVDLGAHDRRRTDAAQRPAAAGHAGWTADWTVVARDGARLVLSVTVQRVQPRDARSSGYLVLAVDVTAERHTRRLLAQALDREQTATRRLEEVHQLRSQFVTTASHELRTPLTSITGYLDLLARQLDGSPASKMLLGRLRRNVARIQHLADQLLLVADEEQSGPGAVPLDLRTVVGPALEAVKCPPGQEVVTVQGSQPVPVLGDHDELSGVLVQLLDNALKFSGRRARVELTVGVRDGQAILEVSDSGPGVPEAERERVLEAFCRGSLALEQAIPGSGVGLSLVRRVVARHSGEVRLDENPAGGTVATVLLPLLQEGMPA